MTNSKPQLFFASGHVDEAICLVKKYHYSHRAPSNIQFVGTFHVGGGLFGDLGEAVAACMFSIPPTRWSEEVLELSRLVRVDGISVELSKLIALSCRWVERLKSADLLVSFADSTQTHHGGIYQACSWNFDGKRDERMDGVIVGGEFIPGRSANSRYGTRSPGRLAERGIDATPHYDLGKYLYWRALNKAGRAKAERLGLRCDSYPKPTPHKIPAPPQPPL